MGNQKEKTLTDRSEATKPPRRERLVRIPETRDNVSGRDRAVHERSESEQIESEKHVENIREKLSTSDKKRRPRRKAVELKPLTAEQQREYQDQHLPPHLKGKKGIVSKILTGLWIRLSGKCEKEGTEHIPEKGPFLVIGNHFGGGDAEAVLETFKKTNVHFGIAKNMWWDTPMRWFLKKFGMIPIEESLSNLTEQEKEEALERQGAHGKNVFRKIIDREKQGKSPMNLDFVRQAVATLLRGDAVAVYPEGLWIQPEGAGKLAREHKEMKKGYPGIELVARMYQKLTGKELPVVPTAYIEDAKSKTRKLIIGRTLTFEENTTEASDTDWAMARVAKMLPEEQRGYYRNLAEETD